MRTGGFQAGEAGPLGSGALERQYEPQNLRPSVAMLTPGQGALGGEDAMLLLTELGDVQDRLDRLRAGLRELLDEYGEGRPSP